VVFRGRVGGAEGAEVEVFDEGGVRSLRFSLEGVGNMEPGEADIVQTCMSLSEPLVAPLDYIEMLLGALALLPAPRDVLLIGLGGGTLANMVRHRTAATATATGGQGGGGQGGCRVSVVESSGVVLELAQRFFGFRPADFHEVVRGDGLQFLQQAVAQGRRCVRGWVRGWVGACVGAWVGG
jgi:spermidine synthase